MNQPAVNYPFPAKVVPATELNRPQMKPEDPNEVEFEPGEM